LCPSPRACLSKPSARQLEKQIPITVKEQIARHKWQIAEIQTDLENASVAQATHTFLSHVTLTCGGYASRSEARRYNSRLPDHDDTEPLRPLRPPLHVGSSSNSGLPLTPPPSGSAFSSSFDVIADVQARPPSKLFPRNLQELSELPEAIVRTLAEEYGLVAGNGGVGRRSAGAAKQGETREDLLNMFLDHIGVRCLFALAFGLA